MNLAPQLLRQANAIFSKCGRPLQPGGQTVVPLYFGILVQGSVSNNSTNVITKEVPGSMPFMLRSIQASQSSSVYINIQLPNGRYLIQAEQLEIEFAGLGSYRYVLMEELECPPGSKIEITLDSSILSPGITENVSFLFEGYYRAVVDSRAPQKNQAVLASQLDRYREEANILAPAWMAGHYPLTPCEEQPFTYGDNFTNLATFAAATGPYSSTLYLSTDLAYDFACRRVLLYITTTGSAAGTVLARARAGSGYALCDDLFDMAQYIGSSFWATDWDIRAGDKVVVDLQLVDFSGVGNVAVQVFLEGVRREVNR
jgi:hypothetical protein